MSKTKGKWETPWQEVDTSVPMDVLQETLVDELIKSLKRSHPDNYHLYVLDRLLTTTGEEAKRTWQRVLDKINLDEGETK